METGYLVHFGQFRTICTFPNLVHTALKAILFLVSLVGGNVIAALVNRSLRFGSLL